VELPSGTVTFLFTDIEGSTRLLHELGDAYADALAGHRRVLREAFARHGGVEVDTQGDAFFAAFPRATDALAAAEQAQAALAAGPLRVRIGVHTGEPVVADEGYVGIDVHRAARIAAAGHGGQILVSQSTRDLVAADGLRDLGEHRLKDLTAPERIYQLGGGEFPPLKSLNTTNLPVAANPLVGREDELRDLIELLTDSTRLVTLTGPGGSGKTRLGLQVAAELTDEFAGGVFFVPLAGVREPELVPSTISATVGIRDVGELRDREALILVDNFEHVLEAAPTLGELLATASRTKLLTTSRAPLRLAGEREYPLDPLPSEDALALLTERARSVRPDFAPDDAAREICRRLDGLPLALELAAPRLRSLGSAALLERLDRRLPLLTAGRRDAPARQRTLRATMEWSYDLLESTLQALFARLAVFAGTFSLEAAEAVAAATLDAVDSLVEASLVKAVDGDRFLMLETIREFASERLEASAAAEEVRRRHVQFYLDFTEAVGLVGEVPGPETLALVRAEKDNLGVALQWTLAHDPVLGLRLATALEGYWAVNPIEGMRWLESLLERASAAPLALRAHAFRAFGGAANPGGRDDVAELAYARSLDAFRELGDEPAAARLLARLGYAAFYRCDLERARALGEEGLAKSLAVGDRKVEAVALGLLGEVDYAEGKRDQGLELMQRSEEVARAAGFTWWSAGMLGKLADCASETGELDAADASARAALALSRELADRLRLVRGLARLARIAAERGEAERAGLLWGAVEAEEARGPVGAWENEREKFAQAVLAQEGAALERGRDEGRRLLLDEALERALSDVD
jgi:predicted ATPase